MVGRWQTVDSRQQSVARIKKTRNRHGPGVSYLDLTPGVDTLAGQEFPTTGGCYARSPGLLVCRSRRAALHGRHRVRAVDVRVDRESDAALARGGGDPLHAGTHVVLQPVLRQDGERLRRQADVAHVVDGFLDIGYLRPLWHARQQTFADTLCRTVVVRD